MLLLTLDGLSSSKRRTLNMQNKCKGNKMCHLGLILFAAMVAHVSCDTRIIGGSLARPGQFPYQVFILIEDIMCGGSIISDNFILTAAHCTDGRNPSQMVVLAGTTNIQDPNSKQFRVAESIIHPQYNKQTHDYDISLIKLSAKIPLGSSTINKIEMVSAGASYPVRTAAVVSGFGVIDSSLSTTPFLRYAHVPLVDSLSCKIFFPITDRMLCAGEFHGQISSCQGDSGGPLTVQNKLLGVVSFGPGCGNMAPAVYANVAVLRSWIKQVSGV